MNDLFAHIKNDDPADGRIFRSDLLADTKRGFSKVRKAFVQKADEKADRSSTLATLVTGKRERAFDALMLLLALEPILEGTPLPLATWAKMLGTDRKPCSTQAASLAFNTLVKFNLAARQDHGRSLVVAPLLEDGSGNEWDNPGSNQSTIGKGYLTIPHEYWTSGLVDELSLPGKAMFLIMLSETTKAQTFAMAADRAPDWYGVSTRTAERGFRELRQQKTAEGSPLLLEHHQFKRNPRSPTGFQTVVHRALSAPYSQAARAELQLTAKTAVRRKASAQAQSQEIAEITSA